MLDNATVLHYRVLSKHRLKRRKHRPDMARLLAQVDGEMTSWIRIAYQARDLPDPRASQSTYED